MPSLRPHRLLVAALAAAMLLLASLAPALRTHNKKAFLKDWGENYKSLHQKTPENSDPDEEEKFLARLADAALERTTKNVVYNGSYFEMDYPGGDVPSHLGVCTDLVIRAYRQLGIDLQKDVHEDMAANFGLYPQWYGDKKPNTNIDHRRVPNLMVFLQRHGKALPISPDGTDYGPGEIIIWDLGVGGLHIGLMTGKRPGGEGSNYYVAHNIGYGPQAEDFLFFPDIRIIGRFQYFGME